MKLPVAFALRVSLSLLIAATLFVSAIAGQTAKRSKRPASKTGGEAAGSSRDGTLVICQGVPLPAGYAIIAYLTSTACPHGAYVLKKQDPYSESLAGAYAKPKQSTKTQSSDAASGNSKPSSNAARVGLTANDDQSVDPFLTPPNRSAISSQAIGPTPATSYGTGPTGPTADPGSRPRRVSSSAGGDAVAVITEDPPDRPARPPQWAGTAPANPSANSTTDTAVDPGPEEVAEGDVVRVDTSLVTVPVTVLDRQGRFIPDLKRDDFTVYENGVEQKIAYWEPADKPFTVALMLDTSPSTQFHLWQIKEAAIAFARQLRPQDRVLIVSFNDQVLLLTEVTNDLNVISAVIEQNAQMGNATRLYDAVHLVIKERLNKIKGRKAIVLFTDGVDTASFQADYPSTMREVEELDALIYPIQYDTSDYMRAMQGVSQGTVQTVTTVGSGPFGIGTTTSRVIYGTPGITGPNGGPLPGSTQADYDRANQYLNELADKTAGRLYHANDTKQLADAFARIAEELRRQYSLGYYPQDGNATSADRRQIKVRVNRPNLAVKARDSYMRTAPTQ